MIEELTKLTEVHKDTEELTIILTVKELKELLSCKVNTAKPKKKS